MKEIQNYHNKHSFAHGKMRIIKRKIGDEEYELYECPICKYEILDAYNAQKYLDGKRKLKYGSKRALSADGWILLILGLKKNKRLYGAILLMKEIFLMIKELGPSLKLSSKGVTFFPYKYGPYSKQIARSLDRLINQRLIDKKGRKSTNKESFKLTNTGKIIAEKLINQIDRETIIKLTKSKKSWDQLQNRGILRKVYSEYPYYRKESEIADFVLQGRRRA